jgi:hypothetical protein
MSVAAAQEDVKRLSFLNITKEPALFPSNIDARERNTLMGVRRIAATWGYRTVASSERALNPHTAFEKFTHDKDGLHLVQAYTDPLMRVIAQGGAAEDGDIQGRFEEAIRIPPELQKAIQRLMQDFLAKDAEIGRLVRIFALLPMDIRSVQFIGLIVSARCILLMSLGLFDNAFRLVQSYLGFCESIPVRREILNRKRKMAAAAKDKEEQGGRMKKVRFHT